MSLIPTADPMKTHYNSIVANGPHGDSNLQHHSLILEESFSTERFMDYPFGIVNSAFTVMVIWEMEEDRSYNSYIIARECNIGSGIVVHGNILFIFTPIMNNNIISYIKHVGCK